MKLLLFAGLLAIAIWLLKVRLRPATGAGREAPATTMSPAEAQAILGLDDLAPTRTDIIEAHRRLMQRVHPDKGGSAHLARQLNEAKRILLANTH